MKPDGKRKNTKGFALAIVMIFITVFVILGVALLGYSRANVQQSAIVMKLDQHFYAAESAAQVGAQSLINAINDPANEDAFKDLDRSDDNIRLEESFKNKLQALYKSALESDGLKDTATKMALSDYNNVSNEGISFEDLEIDGFPTPTVITANPSTPISITITVPAKAEGQEVSVQIVSELKGDGISNGAYFKNYVQDGSPYGGGDDTVKAQKEKTYNHYIKALNDLGGKLDDEADTAKTEAQKAAPLRMNKWPTASSELDGKTHLQVEYPLGPLPEGTYSTLEYIYIGGEYAEGALRLEGTYNFTALKGIIGKGGNLLFSTSATGGQTVVNIPDANHCIVSGWDKISFNPNAWNAYNSPASGHQGNLEINNCIFYSPIIELNYSSHHAQIPGMETPYSGYEFDIVSSSIFYSSDLMNFNGPLGSNSTSGTPQYYLRSPGDDAGKANFNYIDQFNGLFITSNEAPLFDDSTYPVKLNGLFVGNCGTPGQPIVTPVTTKVNDLEGEIPWEDDSLLSGLQNPYNTKFKLSNESLSISDTSK